MSLIATGSVDGVTLAGHANDDSEDPDGSSDNNNNNNNNNSNSNNNNNNRLVTVNVERSAAEIQTMVQRRVQERNSWTVDNVVPNDNDSGLLSSRAREFAQFTTRVLPNYWRFQPPSQPQLDATFPVQPLQWERLLQATTTTANKNNNHQIQITWLGHASCLVQMNGFTFVTDPVFSERCSPSPWFGPKRYRPPPCSIQELVSKLSIDAVLISHNHYDHLDAASVRDIAKYSPHTAFCVPLGLRAWFRQQVSTTIKIYELDWYETAQLPLPLPVVVPVAAQRNNDHHSDNNNNSDNESTTVLRITCLPMRHWSNRSGNDRDQTLWCGFSVETADTDTNITDTAGTAAGTSSNKNNNNHHKKFLFPGDTSWFDGLEHIIGKQYGPFHVAAIPIGAYEPRDFMQHLHINVPEAVRMKDAVKATFAVPIHWGTFPLTVEPVLEPREKLVECMKGRADAESFVPWLIGETKQF